MKFDDILKAIGEFGPYQIKIYLMVCLVAIPCSINQMAHEFFAVPTDHWCDVPEWQESYEDCEDLIGKNDEYLGCLYKYRNASIPIETEDGESYYSQCSQYDAHYKEWEEGYYAGNETTDTRECDDWVYDKSEYEHTIIIDYDLVCDQKAAADFAQSAWFFGRLVGSVIFGQLSDIIGRYYTYYISITGAFLLSTAAAFMPSYWSFVTARTIAGAFSMGAFLLAFVIGTELVGPSRRVIAGVSIQGIFAIGYMILAVIAYYVRDWRVLQLIVAAPYALFLLTIPFVPESARWLITRRRYDQAEKVVLKAAEGNKKAENLPENYMKKLKETEEMKNTHLEKPATMVDIFKSPRLRLLTLNLMYNWFINSLVYYGLSLSTSDLGSNDYVAFFLSGAVEIPAYILCVPLIESPLGRKYTTCGFELLGGVACLITIFLPLGTARTSIAMVGKFGISASYALIYIYSAEIFPTPVRTAGMGLCSVASRIAGILAPLILLLDEYWEPLPLLIFGSTCVVGALLVLFLPETRGRLLPETMNDEGQEFDMKPTRSSYEVNGDDSSSSAGSTCAETNPAYENDEDKI